MLNQEELNNLLDEAIFKVKEAGIEVETSKIVKNVRLSNATSYFGQCKRVSGQYIISISKYYLDGPKDAIFQTLVHEVLHTLGGCMNHGPKWKHFANVINIKYGYNISRASTSQSGVSLNVPVSTYKYIIVCKECGKEYKKKKKCKLVTNTNNYRCGKCHSELALK